MLLRLPLERAKSLRATHSCFCCMRLFQEQAELFFLHSLPKGQFIHPLCLRKSCGGCRARCGHRWTMTPRVSDLNSTWGQRLRSFPLTFTKIGDENIALANPSSKKKEKGKKKSTEVTFLKRHTLQGIGRNNKLYVRYLLSV